MLQKLLIRNYAIIESLEMNFSEHLTIITGETGAGKSILLGALGMILGNRADTKVLYNQSEKCVIEAYFEISRYDLKAFFEENEIDYEQNSVVRRELTPAGKTRTFINDTPVNLNQLRQFTSALVDLHQQFDNLDIHEVSFQIRMIDALADNKSRLETYQTRFRQYQTDQRALAQLQEKVQSSAREVEFLNFQLAEFNKAELIDGEQDTLEIEQQRLQNAETIKRNLGQSFRALNDMDNSIVSQLQTVGQLVNAVKKFSPEVQKLNERLDGLTYELQDLAGELEQIAEDTEFNGERITEIQLRLDTIYKLQKKHNVANIADLLNIQTALQTQLEQYGDLSGNIEQLTEAIAEHEVVLNAAADALTQRRQSVVTGFEGQIHELLRELSMENARLEVQITPFAQLTMMGRDNVNFMFAANRGSRLQSIKDVASGGEISRLTLCVKSLVASAIPLPTLIFDEIDSGVSGDVALKMGNILQRFAAHHQVVVITHSPQVASKAHTHYFVYKTLTADRTLTSIRTLDKTERIEKIATMLSQSPPSQSAMMNARELLGY
jgi:DNA repair protein RecN (Recombination protein N)